MLLEQRISRALLGPATDNELPDQATLDRNLAAATEAFDSCHYVRLANQLPGLINAASALDTTPSGAAFATEVYLLCGNALGKILVSGFQPLASDRAARAAENSGDPMLMAAAWRHVSGSARRFGSYDTAEEVGIRAVEALPITSTTPDRLRRRIAELWNATGYAAAVRGDADRSAECYRESHQVISTIRDPGLRQKGEDAAAAHQISAAFKLEDSTLALTSASRVRVGTLPTVERSGRYLVDVAMAWHLHGDPLRSYRALVTAESYASGEVRTRTAARQLIASLAASPQRGMPEIAGLAHRARVAV